MAENLKVGMYVSCPVKIEDGSDINLIGQISNFTSNGLRASVRFFDNTPSQGFVNYYPQTANYDVADLQRARTKIGARVRVENLSYYVRSLELLDEDDYYYYYVDSIYEDGNSTLKLGENEIRIHLADMYNSPLDEFSRFNFAEPEWYLNRSIISESQAHLLKSPYGIGNILSARINIYPHQVDTILKGLSQRPCRLMLADEAGLGKTIEAGAILKGIISKDKDARVLILVPDPLIDQWAQELHKRFNIKRKSIRIVTTNYIANTPGIYILAFSHANDYSFNIQGDFSVLVIDEAHRLLSMPRLYSKALNASKETENVLLLTATPVQHESAPYRQLLKLLNPNRFSALDDSKFNRLVSLQPEIIYTLTKLNRYLNKFIERNRKATAISLLGQLNTELVDSKLEQYIQVLNETENEEALLLKYKRVLRYLREKYVIEKDVIRHRKAEIPGGSAKRDLREIVYTPAGEDLGFYESDTYDAAINWFSDLLEKHSDSDTVRDCKNVLQATTSSPYAVLGIFNISSVPTGFDGLVGDYFAALKKWLVAYDWEVSHINELRESPCLFHSKLAEIIKWIESEDTSGKKKYLIYSQYPRTANNYYEAFKKYFGEDTTRKFAGSMNKADLYKATQDFQDNEECRFLICDKAGGEGCNFQMADCIIHTDISWSPAVMEQRIGRLDRIGREADRDVISVVIHTDYGVENDLFNVYNDGMNIFKESISGMEIKFDEYQKLIDEAFTKDPDHGLEQIIPTIKTLLTEIKAAIDEELYLRSSLQLDEGTSDQADELISYFDISDNSKLCESLLWWAKSIGLSSLTVNKSFYDQVDTVNIDPYKLDDLALIRYSYALPFDISIDEDITGTFLREVACKHEKLFFFAPNSLFYDSITKNALSRPEGIATCLHVPDSGINWKGFVFTWNPHFNYSPLIENDLDSSVLPNLGKYIFKEQIPVFISFDDLQVYSNPELIEAFSNLGEKAYNLLSNDEIIERFDGYSLEDIASIAKQGNDISLNNAREEYLAAFNTNGMHEEIQDVFISKANKAVGYRDFFKAYSDSLLDPVMVLDSLALLIFD